METQTIAIEAPDRGKLQKDVMFARMAFSNPRQSTKVQAEAVGVSDQRRVRGSAKIFTSKEYEAIGSHAAMRRQGLKQLGLALPACLDGVVVLPKAMLADVIEYCQQTQREREDLVETFLTTALDNERYEGQLALGSAYRPEFYEPNTVRAAFGMTYSIFSMDVPDDLPPEIREAEAEKWQAQRLTMYEEARAALRLTLKELIDHLLDKLQPEDDGSRKRFYATNLTNLTDFLATVSRRDITGDDQLQQLAIRAKSIVAPYTSDDLKKANGAALDVSRNLTDVKAQLDSLIQREQSRGIDLDLD